ncbi:Holliday junction resolvase RuvX [Bacillota bacterium Meth-B3]|nr:Holliday junction resolvase RuvX [Christensenellaceae bacterium]MEA5065716.1 Holliday junction resolvase RuvX [Eubacteriales bacterium]MEA5069886.1 Holliday junction resolvase RuvX [Christensenellaceae bacterium]
MKRVLALDVGEKRIGVAVSDPLGLTAQGVETIFTKGSQRDCARIVELAAQYETDRVVVGLPRSMDGSCGFQAERVRAFAAGLTQHGLTLKWQDERLTSASATRTLIEGNVRRDKRKQVIDKLAATYILQAFLDAGGWDGNR